MKKSTRDRRMLFRKLTVNIRKRAERIEGVSALETEGWVCVEGAKNNH